MNQALKDWRAERLAEIQSYERVVRDHIEGMKLRAEHYEEPMRSEVHSCAVLFENMTDWITRHS